MNIYQLITSKKKSWININSSLISNYFKNIILKKMLSLTILESRVVSLIQTWLLLMIMSNSSFGQSLMTFNGSFPNGTTQQGKATYKYYEDPQTREYVIEGPFNYNFDGKDDNKGLKQTISGNYEKGLKHGTWRYKLIMNDYFMGYYHATGTIILTANYKNGLAEGNWKYYSKNKTRLYNRYTGWGAYNPENIVTTSMNFGEGRIVGNVSINEEGVIKVNGNYDQNSYSVGTWKINLLDKNQNLEITYKNNYMTDFIGRNSVGQILDGSTSLYSKENAEDYQRYLNVSKMSNEERENAGFSLDTFCREKNIVTKYVKPYFKNMMSTDWFLHKFIKGDLTYKSYSYNYEVPGGCNIVVQKVNYYPLEKLHNYKKAEAFFNSGLFLNAFDSYSNIRKEIKIDYLNIKTADLKKINEKLQISFSKADSLSKHLITRSELYSFEKVFGKTYPNGTKKIDQINESFSEISDLLKNNWKVEIDEIISAFNSQNLEYFRPYQSGALYNLDKYINEVWEDEIKFCRNSKPIYFNNKSLDDKKEANVKGVEYCNCNKDSLINKLTIKMKNCFNEIHKALSISKQIESKVNHIDMLNLSIKTKRLYPTYERVLSDFKSRYTDASNFSGSQTMDDYLYLITKINLSLDKIIAIYKSKDDKKAMDKALKRADNLRDKHKLLFPLLSFTRDGYLDWLYDN